MPVLVNSILAALPPLSTVGLLLSFFFVVLAIVGTELFKGVLHYRCAAPGMVETADHPSLTYDPMLGEGETEEHGRRLQMLSEAAYAVAHDAITGGVKRLLKGATGSGAGAVGQAAFDSGTLFCDPFEEGAAVCPAKYPTCAYFDANVNYGVTTFDSIGWSVIIILQTLTFDLPTIPFVLPIITFVVTKVISNNIALSLGMVGALSIVRFRAAIKEPEELVFLFLIIAAGLGAGSGQIKITAVGVIFSLLGL